MPTIKKSGVFSSHPFFYMSVKMLFPLIIVLLVSGINLYLFNLKGSWHEIISSPGLYIDMLVLCLLLFMLLIVIKVVKSFPESTVLKLGLYLWVISATLDVMDEIIVQSKYVGYFMEDLTKLSGMLLVAISLYKIIKRIDSMYVDAKIKSLRDELTQLPNRRFFIDALKARQDQEIALLIIDIDFFKKINDTYGHLVGDDVLYKFGKLLSSMSSDDFLATRIGGEEFAIIISGKTRDEVNDISLKIINVTKKIVIKNNTFLSVSIGVGIKSRNEPSESFIKSVDKALYRAKDEGRGRVVWATGR